MHFSSFNIKFRKINKIMKKNFHSFVYFSVLHLSSINGIHLQFSLLFPLDSALNIFFIRLLFHSFIFHYTSLLNILPSFLFISFFNFLQHFSIQKKKKKGFDFSCACCQISKKKKTSQFENLCVFLISFIVDGLEALLFFLIQE